MQVLALGFPRTETASMKIALETLGYVRTNHGFDVDRSKPAELDMWNAAIRAKFYGGGTPYGREEWDRLLGNCQAVSDAPHILFAKVLIAAYQDAKAVLTTRNLDSWWKSYETTIMQVMKPMLQVRLSSWMDHAYAKQWYLFRLAYKALFLYGAEG
ncbi:hypothetical protein DFH09DRAFT_1135632 [Mycena vulgaris]|nr:hypothetical protein DFH09DRAFT_1135632 [Mycena vulgaris]